MCTSRCRLGRYESRPRVLCCRSSRRRSARGRHRAGGALAVYPAGHHADESAPDGNRARFRRRDDALSAGAVGQVACGAQRAGRDCDAAVPPGGVSNRTLKRRLTPSEDAFWRTADSERLSSRAILGTGVRRACRRRIFRSAGVQAWIVLRVRVRGMLETPVGIRVPFVREALSEWGSLSLRTHRAGAGASSTRTRDKSVLGRSHAVSRGVTVLGTTASTCTFGADSPKRRG